MKVEKYSLTQLKNLNPKKISIDEPTWQKKFVNGSVTVTNMERVSENSLCAKEGDPL